MRGWSSNYTVPAVVSQTVIYQCSFQCSSLASPASSGPMLKHTCPRPSYLCDTDRGHRLSSSHTSFSFNSCVTKVEDTLATCSILLWKLFVKTSFHNSFNVISVKAYNTSVSCFPAILARPHPLCFAYTHWSPLSSS